MNPADASLRTSVLRGAGGTALVRGGSALLAFLSTLVLTHALGAADYGAYSFAYTTVVALATVAVAGLDQLAVRDTPAATVRGRPEELASLLRGAPRLVLAVSAAVVLVAGAVALVAGGNLADHLLLALPLCPLLALTLLAQGFLYGAERVVVGLAVGMLLRQLIFLVAVGVGYLALADRLGSEAALALQVGAAAFALLASGAVLMRALPAPARTAPGRPAPRRWLEASVPMGLSTGVLALSSALPVAALGLIATDADAGLYAAAAQLTLPFALLFSSARNPLAPVLSRLWTASQHDRLQRGVTSATRGLALVTTALALAMALLAGPLLDLFGQGFDEAAGALRIVLVGVVVNAAFAFNGLVLIMTGHERAAAVSAVAALALQAVLAIALIPPLGIEGAALAYTASAVVRNLVNSLQAWRRVGISTSPLS